MPWRGIREGNPLFIDAHSYRWFPGSNTLLKLQAILAHWQKHKHNSSSGFVHVHWRSFELVLCPFLAFSVVIQIVRIYTEQFAVKCPVLGTQQKNVPHSGHCLSKFFETSAKRQLTALDRCHTNNGTQQQRPESPRVTHLACSTRYIEFHQRTSCMYILYSSVTFY